MTEQQIDQSRSLFSFEYLKLMLYGLPGSGKSWVADSANDDPRTSPALHLNCAGNPVTAVRKPNRYIVDISKYRDVNDWYHYLTTGNLIGSAIEQMDAWMARDALDTPVRFRTLILDQLSDLQSRQLDVVLGNVGAAFGSAPKRATRGDFGMLLAMTTQLARLLFALPMHVIFCAWESPIYASSDPPVVSGYEPALIGQAARVVPGHALALARMVAANRLSSTQRSKLPGVAEAHNVAIFKADKALTKDQYDVFGDVMVEPSVTKLADCMAKGGYMI